MEHNLEEGNPVEDSPADNLELGTQVVDKHPLDILQSQHKITKSKTQIKNF